MTHFLFEPGEPRATAVVALPSFHLALSNSLIFRSFSFRRAVQQRESAPTETLFLRPPAGARQTTFFSPRKLHLSAGNTIFHWQPGRETVLRSVIRRDSRAVHAHPGVPGERLEQFPLSASPRRGSMAQTYNQKKNVYSIDQILGHGKDEGTMYFIPRGSERRKLVEIPRGTGSRDRRRKIARRIGRFLRDSTERSPSSAAGLFGVYR